MILVDTSVIIDALQSNSARLLTLMQTHDAAICGVTRAEVLSGSRGPSHRQKLLAVLDSLNQAAMPDSLWDQVGEHLAALRLRGITVPLGDAVIATVAMALDVELWSRDRHFANMQSALPSLRLFQEPP